ncbi:glutamyl-tRNA synthetase [Ophiocordyceps camponoti-floridani]|uniref:Glutamate--tRNA ligase, mitochondrial n=1 Tax=Ophiocordyceps camponoti-floridani TaxID=2030778 RepID=A0A8H4Q939_9HYPO|nr:glutamyl-tRNA synthetase [Ophiocordyceps camponoti-floridani]
MSLLLLLLLTSRPTAPNIRPRRISLRLRPPSLNRLHQTSTAPAPQPKPGTATGIKGLWRRSTLRKNVVDASTRTILGQSADVPIRARFAPSPTGYLHLGSLRTALFNNLAARASQGGAFILRIEDTDQSRLVHDAEKRLLSDLEWAGLSWDEGPDRGGPYGPYRQSERLPLYAHHANQLVEKGQAYRCFCTPSEIESQKRLLHDQGQPTIYNQKCRPISVSESDRRAQAGEPHVLRFRSDGHAHTRFRDAVYGVVQMNKVHEDFVLVKSDGFPTYHFANVVDDHAMAITHVIRGEEWLISTSKHVALYLAFGWKPPIFAHLGLLVDDSGAKLSKRHESVSLATYQDGIVFPLALLSWLAHLGSSFKPDATTPRSIDNMADALTFKFTRGAIKLNPSKLNHFQSLHRESLLTTPPQSLTPQESTLIKTNLITPLLTEITTITNSPTSDLPPPGTPP